MDLWLERKEGPLILYHVDVKYDYILIPPNEIKAVPQMSISHLRGVVPICRFP